MNLKIIGFVGLPGSGKGEACRIAAMYGLPVLVMGDVIRREAARLGVEPTDQNLGRIGSDLRAAEGPDAVARRVLEMAQATGGDVVVVDGLRSLEEAEFSEGMRSVLPGGGLRSGRGQAEAAGGSGPARRSGSWRRRRRGHRLLRGAEEPRCSHAGGEGMPGTGLGNVRGHEVRRLQSEK